MDPLAFVLGVVAVLGLGGAAWALVGRSRAVARGAAAEARAVRAEAEVGARAEAVEGLRLEVAALGAARDESSERVLALSRELAEARTLLETARQRLDERDALEKRFAEAFEALTAKALKAGREEFLQQARPVFEAAMKQQTELVKPIGATLEKTQERLIALTQQIGTAGETTRELREETARLAKALSRPEVRGRYGEIQLRRVAELAGMTSYCDFSEQASVRDSEGNLLRPDMVVTLPNERVIAVDAKTNVFAYIEAVNSTSDEDRERHLNDFARHVAEQAKKLADKRYWSAWEGSPEFVVMFVPGDHFIDAALARRPDLLDEAAQRSVILASPSTLIGLLRAVAVGWREHRLAEEARELFALGRDLHERVAVALEHAAKVGAAIDQAARRYNQFVGSMEGRVLPQLRRFEEAGVKSGRELVELPEVEVATRLVEGQREVAGEA